MKNKPYKIRLFLLNVCLVTAFLVGCLTNLNNQSATIVPFQTMTESTTSTRSVGTHTLTPIQSPVPSLSATNTSTSTSIPTPPGNTIQDKLKYLDETNGGCTLPCLWGIEPGETKWADVDPYLHSFVELVERGSFSPYYSGLIYRTEYPSFIHQDQTLATLFYVEFQGPNKGTIEVISTLSNHNLAYFLSILGSPDQVWINLEPLEPSDFSLVIYYKAGVMLFYRGLLPDHQDQNNFVICPEDVQNKITDLWLWDPASGKSWQDIGKMSTIIPPLTSDDYLRSLEELTDLQMKDFYNMFLDSSGVGCVKISASKWYKNP